MRPGRSRSSLASASPAGEPVITSHDIAYAFERIATPSLAAQYAFYYSNIAGWGAYAAARRRHLGHYDAQQPDNHVPPDDPDADFLYRMSLPANRPIPEEVAKCSTAPGGYGRT